MVPDSPDHPQFVLPGSPDSRDYPVSFLNDPVMTAPIDLVIFGASGDLTRRKILPALGRLVAREGDRRTSPDLSRWILGNRQRLTTTVIWIRLDGRAGHSPSTPASIALQVLLEGRPAGVVGQRIACRGVRPTGLSSLPSQDISTCRCRVWGYARAHGAAPSSSKSTPLWKPVQRT